LIEPVTIGLTVITGEILLFGGGFNLMDFVSQQRFDESQRQIALAMLYYCEKGFDEACRDISNRREWDRYVRAFQTGQAGNKALDAPNQAAKPWKYRDILDACIDWRRWMGR
jgi:hypothetical protein